MAELAKYVEIRRILRILKHIAKTEIYGKEVFGGENFSDKGGVNNFIMYVNALVAFPELADIQEFFKCQNAARNYLISKTPEHDYNVIVANLNLAIAKTEDACEKLKPYRNKPNKELVVQSIRTYQERERNAASESEKMSHGYELVGKLKSLVPGLEAEDVFVCAEEAIWNRYPGISDTNQRTILLKEQIGEVVGKVMGEYGIGEDEIESSKTPAMSVVPIALVPEKEEEELFSEFDTNDIEKGITELLEHLAFGTEVADGKLNLKIPFETFERTFSRLNSALETSQFLHLKIETKRVIDSLSSFRDDPEGLRELTKNYVHVANREIDHYKDRIRTKGKSRSA